MKLRFATRSLYCLTAMLMGVVLLIGTCIQDFNAHMDVKPNPISDALTARLSWQYAGGWLLMVAPVIVWLSSAQNRAKLIRNWILVVVGLAAAMVVFFFIAMLVGHH